MKDTLVRVLRARLSQLNTFKEWRASRTNGIRDVWLPRSAYRQLMGYKPNTHNTQGVNMLHLEVSGEMNLYATDRAKLIHDLACMLRDDLELRLKWEMESFTFHPEAEEGKNPVQLRFDIAGDSGLGFEILPVAVDGSFTIRVMDEEDCVSAEQVHEFLYGPIAQRILKEVDLSVIQSLQGGGYFRIRSEDRDACEDPEYLFAHVYGPDGRRAAFAFVEERVSCMLHEINPPEGYELPRPGLSSDDDPSMGTMTSRVREWGFLHPQTPDRPPSRPWVSGLDPGAADSQSVMFMLSESMQVSRIVDIQMADPEKVYTSRRSLLRELLESISAANEQPDAAVTSVEVQVRAESEQSDEGGYLLFFADGYRYAPGSTQILRPDGTLFAEMPDETPGVVSVYDTSGKFAWGFQLDPSYGLERWDRQVHHRAVERGVETCCKRWYWPKHKQMEEPK